MEQDFGKDHIDLDDDYVQDYSHYNKCNDLDDEDYDDEFDYDEDNIEVGYAIDRDRSGDNKVFKKVKNNIKNDSNTRLVMNFERKEKKKKKNYFVSGLSLYYNTILSWNIDKLKLNNRNVLGLIKMSKAPSSFHSRSLYFNAMNDVVLEESRASIVQSLLVPSNSLRLQLLKIHNKEQGVNFRLVEFRIREGDIEYTRPGWTFKMEYCYDKEEYNNNNNNNNRIENKNKHNKRNFSSMSSTLNTLKESQYKVEFISVVAQNSTAMQLSKISNDRILPLWISDENCNYLHREIEQNPIEKRNDIKAVVLTSLIAYQRMSSVCNDELAPPFVSKLIGNPPSKLIRFDESTDEDEAAKEDWKIERKISNSKNIKNRNSRYNISASASSSDGDSSSSECIIVVVTDTDSGIDSETDSNDEIELNPIQLDLVKGMERKGREQIISLNKSQLVALRDCVSCTVAVGEGKGVGSNGNLQLVQGPPGCGKTHFLVSLLHVLVSRRYNMCVCAPSNKAVCVALEKFLNTDGASISQCVLVGVEDKLESCSITSVINTNKKTFFPKPILPESLTNLTCNFIYPTLTADIFAYTYSSRINKIFIAFADTINQIFLSPPTEDYRSLFSYISLLTLRTHFISQELYLVTTKLQKNLHYSYPKFIKKYVDIIQHLLTLLLSEIPLMGNDIDIEPISEDNDEDNDDDVMTEDTMYSPFDNEEINSEQTFNNDNNLPIKPIVNVEVDAEIIKISKGIRDNILKLSQLFDSSCDSDTWAQEYISNCDIIFCTLTTAGILN
jgi:hypothetical protein